MLPSHAKRAAGRPNARQRKGRMKSWCPCVHNGEHAQRSKCAQRHAAHLFRGRCGLFESIRHLGSITAANWVSFDFNDSYSSCWGYSLINTLKLNKTIHFRCHVCTCVQIFRCHVCACVQILSGLTGWSSTKYYACAFLVLAFCVHWSIFVAGATFWSGQTSATPSLRHVVGFCMHARAHTGLRAHATFFHGKRSEEC